MYLEKEGSHKNFYQRSYNVILINLPNAINEMFDTISFHKHLKANCDLVNAFLRYAYGNNEI